MVGKAGLVNAVIVGIFLSFDIVDEFGSGFIQGRDVVGIAVDSAGRYLIHSVEELLVLHFPHDIVVGDVAVPVIIAVPRKHVVLRIVFSAQQDVVRYVGVAGVHFAGVEKVGAVVVGVAAEIGVAVREIVVGCARNVTFSLEIFEIDAVFTALQRESHERYGVAAGEHPDADVFVVDDRNGADVGKVLRLVRLNLDVDAVGAGGDGSAVVHHPHVGDVLVVKFQVVNLIVVAGGRTQICPALPLVAAEHYLEMVDVAMQVGVGGPLDGGAPMAGICILEMQGHIALLVVGERGDVAAGVHGGNAVVARIEAWVNNRVDPVGLSVDGVQRNRAVRAYVIDNVSHHVGFGFVEAEHDFVVRGDGHAVEHGGRGAGAVHQMRGADGGHEGTAFIDTVEVGYTDLIGDDVVANVGGVGEVCHTVRYRGEGLRRKVGFEVALFENVEGVAPGSVERGGGRFPFKEG